VLIVFTCSADPRREHTSRPAAFARAGAARPSWWRLLFAGLLFAFACSPENASPTGTPPPEGGSAGGDGQERESGSEPAPDGPSVPADTNVPDSITDARDASSPADVSLGDARDAASIPDAWPGDARETSLIDVPTEADSPGRPADGASDALDVRSSDVTPLPGCDLAASHTRADRALADFLLGFWNGGNQYLDAAEPTNNQSTGYWTFAQGFDALLDGVERTKGRHFSGLVRSFALGQDARGWTSDFYDDENWMALALMRAFDWTNDRIYLDRAVTLFRDIAAAWDSTSARPGGIWWDRAHTQKATASNAGPVITGARLTNKTGDATHLTFARQVYDHWRTTMVDATTFQVSDHVNPDGTIVRWRFTYNEGLMIGAALELYAATGEARYLTDAHSIAAAMVRDQTRSTAAGTVLFDGTNTGCTGDCAQFKGIGYRYLAALLRMDPSHVEYRPVLQGSAEALWTLARRSDSGLFSIDWAGPTMATAITGQQSSAVMALNILAALCGVYPGDPAIGYEAEDALIDHVALEATHLGFSGWGYVAAWAADGQSVEFAVQAPTGGNYRLTFDYAAAAGDAARAVVVNGGAAVPRLVFPSTGSWDAWSEIGATVTLPAGESRIKILYDAAGGSAQYLNLDRLRMAAAP
jgi:predicted alpha-1,6-mannanase (GH76 family)